MCAALHRLAECREFREAEIAALADFIRTDLAAHIADEEEVLFPLLQQKCEAGDEIDKALARLDREHEADRDLSAQVRLFLLEAITKRLALIDIPDASGAVRTFARNQRQHMMLENAVLIPIARRRLSPNDLAALGRRLAARRDAAQPGEAR
jgi:iron-sulfur cluster repair protein YtfE (RIC family)